MLIDDNFEISKANGKEFSIVMAFHNDTHLSQSIESIINQSIGFKDSIQLILVDCKSSDESLDTASRYEKQFPENIFILTADSANTLEGYNLGFEYATGEYVNFAKSSDRFDVNCFSQISDGFGKYDTDIIALPVSIFSNEKTTPRAYSVRGIIDLNKMPDNNLKFTYSSFFKKSLVDDLRFNSKITYSSELSYVTKALLKTKKYVLLDTDANYFYRQRSSFDEESFNDGEFYLNEIKYFILELLEYSTEKYGRADDFVKREVLQRLEFLYKDNPICDVLSDGQLSEFFTSLKKALGYFEADEINSLLTDQSGSSFLVAVKNEYITLNNIINHDKDIFDVEITKSNAVACSDNVVLDDLSKRPIVLDFATLRDGVVYFSGYIKSILNRENISLSAIKEYADGNVEIIDATFFDYPTRSSSYMMGLEWQTTYNFDLEVPIKSKKEVSSVKLVAYYKENDKKATLDCPIEFREYCNISYLSHYYVKDDMIVMFDGKFNIMPYSYAKLVRYEIRGLMKVFRKREPFFLQALFFRVCHLLLYPYMKNREIWMIMDRKHAADDNAEHFYKYALKQDDGIKKFFSINQTSPDFKRLNDAYGNILACESIKHRFYYTFTDKIISSQGSEYYLNPFENRRYPQTAGISNLDFYFLQHGIIKDNMSSWLRKYDRNPKLIVTSTQLEYESLFDEGYNYSDKVIQLLGLPRYDNLNNQGLKKQIVIMPSWRNFLTDEREVLKSEFFRRFNSLINNERLINHAKSLGYEIVFKPHPELVPYLYLFDKNDYVQIDEEKKYQVIFNESALLVTDYSSIFFDFSYLKKPLIYYQYANDYHYDSDNGYFQYESMGFGPVIDSEDNLVDKLIEYMDNGCVMEDTYKKRVDSFFKYHDHNNSKRCYDWIVKH
ncbi:MAG: CDP-glycerol glycerophosphotransferase family protein [Methanobrevibacter sp.]|nr:CDP-glycerol glycerophosphotransferase family protein [Methanobrevibacter sp.]